LQSRALPCYGMGMDTKNPQTSTLSLSLPKALKRELKIIAVRREIPLGSLLADIVSAWLKERGNGPAV
jgi:hypothetical protein